MLVRVHPVITSHKAAAREIEELADPTVDLCFFQVLLEHPGCVLASLVFVPQVYSPLAWLHSAAKEVPDHTRSIQTRPLDQVHEFFDLPGVLLSVHPANYLLRYIADIVESCVVQLLPDVKPLTTTE